VPGSVWVLVSICHWGRLPVFVLLVVLVSIADGGAAVLRHYLDDNDSQSMAHGSQRVHVFSLVLGAYAFFFSFLRGATPSAYSNILAV